MEQCKQGLKENLFILHPRLSPALLAIQDRCVANLKDKLMAAIESNTTYTLEEFKRCHHVKLQLVSMYVYLFQVLATYLVKDRFRDRPEVISEFNCQNLYHTHNFIIYQGDMGS